MREGLDSQPRSLELPDLPRLPGHPREAAAGRRLLIAARAACAGRVAGVLLLAATLPACSAVVDQSGSAAAPSTAAVEAPSSDAFALDECSTPNLTVVNPGQVTIGAAEVDRPPLFVDGDPTTGEGFEAALGYAVAETLGFPAADVAWVVLDAGDDPFGSGPRVDFVMGQVPVGEPTDTSVTSDPYLAPASGAPPFGLLFAAGNPLVSCVNGALAELEASGELSALAEAWLAGTPWEGSRVGSAARVS